MGVAPVALGDDDLADRSFSLLQEREERAAEHPVRKLHLKQEWAPVPFTKAPVE